MARMRRLAGVLVGISLTILAAGARAADAPPPPPTPPPPPGGFAPYPGPYGYPPAGPPYGNAGPYGNGYPYGPPPANFVYETQKKNEMLALVIEFFVPGVGSIYADHVGGALITWAATVGGVAVFFWWIGQNFDNRNNGGSLDNGSRDTWAIYLALGLIFGGRIYGLVDSYTSARDFNRRLRARLGMPEWAALGVVPIRTDRSVSWGPSLGFRF
jgi:hypothetical protein